MVWSTPHLNDFQKASVYYHDFFDYPLVEYELDKWVAGKKVKLPKQMIRVTHDKNREFYFLRGRDSLVRKRKLRTQFSNKKFSRGQWAACWLNCLPSVKMVALTGSMAMGNAKKDSDIDLMVITSRGLLWTTRLLSIIFLKVLGFPLRRAGEKEEKDKLCLNLWLDEGNLRWKERNAFVAHEIAQIIPLAFRDQTNERFVWENRWIVDYWPKVVRIKKPPKQKRGWGWLFWPVELFAYWGQYLYMRKKITHERISRTRAQFHPTRLRANGLDILPVAPLK